MIEFSVFDPSKIIGFHITKKSGYLSVFDSSKIQGLHIIAQCAGDLGDGLQTNFYTSLRELDSD